MNAQIVRELSTQGAEDVVDTHLGSLSDLGVTWVRASTDWQSLEPAPPGPAGRVFDFATHDRWVEALARHGLRWYVTGIGIATPEWNREPASASACAERSPPTPGAFADMMTALAERYGAEGSFWAEHPELDPLPVREYELWNEPNFGVFWCPGPDPASYATLAVTASRAVKRVGPESKIILGGLAGFNEVTAPLAEDAMAAGTFMRRAVTAEPALRTSISSIGLHPYAGTPAAVVESVAGFRAELDELGISAPISVNEIGWPTSGVGGLDPVSEETREGFFSELPGLVVNSGCRVDGFAPHAWLTRELDPANPEDWFGLADPATAERYPSADRYGEAAERLTEGSDELPASATVCGGS